MRFLSLFSGIEAASVAWSPLGWECLAVAEVEKYCCSALAHHYPSTPNLGDVTGITEQQIQDLGPIDVVVFGFPCQDLSVAGQRKGLKNDDGTSTRSGLFFDAMRIAEWSRARWTVAENVPGLFSHDRGRSFAAVVGEMAGARFDVPENGWQNTGVAAGPSGLVEWSVLDAQWFGVPQRRKRVFLVRDTGDWRNRPPILFDAHSLSGDSPPSRETKSNVARDPTACLNSGGNTGGFRTEPGEHLVAFDTTQITSSANYSNPKPGDPCHPIAARAHPPAVAYRTTGNNGVYETGDRTGALNCATDPNQHIVAYQCHGSNVGPMGHLRSGNGNESGGVPFLGEAMGVRRLTPRECERLQGFPDDFTKIPYRNKPAGKCPDGPRYKAIGNSMAVPVMRWVGERLESA